nr:MAG TPA: hypothetical protein [Caudoviricetes sp.]
MFSSTNQGITDTFSTAILTCLFCPHFVDKSSSEHYSASGLLSWSDEKICTNLMDFILSVIPQIR